MSIPSIYVQAGLEVCCHAHRMILPLRYYHRSNNYRILIDTTIRTHKGQYDFIFVHGMVAPEEVSYLGSAKHRGAKIIWNLDDDYLAIPEWHPHKPKHVDVGSMRIVSEICHAAIFTHENLRDSTTDVFPSLKGKSFVAPNLLEPSHYRPNWEVRKARKKPLVMWIGSPTHNEDLEILLPVVKSLHEGWQNEIDLIFFGSAHPEMRARYLGGAFKEFSCCNFQAYPQTLADFSPDIMLCPLADDSFARGRSDLKVKEAMAMGAAVLYSPVGPFKNFPYGIRCENSDQFLISIITALISYKNQSFWKMCELNRSVAEREFFWSAQHAGRKQWDDVLDEVLNK